MRSKTDFLRILGGIAATTGLAVIGWGFALIINASQPRPNGTGLPIKWAPGSVTMRILAANTTPLSDGLTRATSIQAAMDDSQRGWNRNLGDMQLAPTIQAAGTGSNGNGRNEIFFSDSPYGGSWDTNTLAVTTTWHSGNERVEADIIFNTAYTWDSYRGTSRAVSGVGPYDIQRVALHELGHVLGLDHPDEAGQTVSAIMNSHISSLDSLTTDDITGAQSLYGPPGSPANDNFANATEIVLTGSPQQFTGYNTNATKEVGEPNHAGNIGGRSVWWKWTAPSDGSTTIDTKGSYFDTTLAVYTGSSVSALSEVASDDDIQDGVVQASTVTFNAVKGTTYHIAVDGFNGLAQGDTSGADSAGITLNITFSGTVGGTAPAITTQPSSLTVTAGSNASFSVAATGTAPLSYQWNFNGNAISGATNTTYTVSGAQSANAGTYTVTVSNAYGSVTSNGATLTVNAAQTTPPPSSGGGGGGGGGGAPSGWFLAALGVAGLARLLRERRTSRPGL